MSTIEDKNILEDPKKVENLGCAVRLTEQENQYRVEQSPLLKNGEIDGSWNVFGGSVGYTDSTFDTEEDALEFYEDVQNLAEEELADKYSGFWVNR